MQGIPLLICSIGNPTATYAKTLHSAGHVALQSLQDFPKAGVNKKFELWQPHLGGQMSLPRPVKRFKWTGFASEPNVDDWTLWMSGTLMNVSGPAVRKVWEKWRASSDLRKETGRLVVVHDEMEKEVGKYMVKTDPKSSAKYDELVRYIELVLISFRGHNGVKSIQASLPNTPFIRIGIGIGRPVSRETDVIVKHVLRTMSAREFNAIEDIGQQIHGTLRDVQNGYIK
jgi:PTH1 family peptidyl-tRNA hydrolase